MDQLILGLVLRFRDLTDEDFFSLALKKNNIEISSDNSSVLLKPPPHLAFLFNQFNNASHSKTLILKMLKFTQKEKFLPSSILIHVH